MKIIHFIILFFIALFSWFPVDISADASNCQFSGGDIKEEFKNCNPDHGVRSEAWVNLNLGKPETDGRDIIDKFIARVQIVTSIIAIGIIVWIGLILVLPVSAEAKESAKAKVFSVLIGFLFMIGATIIVNGLVNILYEIFSK